MNAETQPTKNRQPTHGCSLTFTGSKDGKKRYMEVVRLDDGSIAFCFKTYWDGEDAAPMTTAVSLQAESFNAFHALLTEFSLNRDSFAAPVAG